MVEKSKPGAPPAGGKIHTDERGRSVWSADIGNDKFDLVTTQELRGILESSDAASRRAIEDVAANVEDEGVLARNAETGMFQIIGETALQEILNSDATPQAQSGPADGTPQPKADSDDEQKLSLVSTQALRKLIAKEPADQEDVPVAGSDFDPYNSS